MGCNCGKKKATTTTPKPADTASTGQTQTFSLTTREGRTLRFGSRLEAEAARVRAGGGTIQ